MSLRRWNAQRRECVLMLAPNEHCDKMNWGVDPHWDSLSSRKRMILSLADIYQASLCMNHTHPWDLGGMFCLIHNKEVASSISRQRQVWARNCTLKTESGGSRIWSFLFFSLWLCIWAKLLKKGRVWFGSGYEEIQCIIWGREGLVGGNSWLHGVHCQETVCSSCTCMWWGYSSDFPILSPKFSNCPPRTHLGWIFHPPSELSENTFSHTHPKMSLLGDSKSSQVEDECEASLWTKETAYAFANTNQPQSMGNKSATFLAVLC